MSIEKDQKFKKLFWEWFDSIPTKEKEKYWYFKLDLATSYYYNKIYSRIVEQDNEQVYGSSASQTFHHRQL